MDVWLLENIFAFIHIRFWKLFNIDIQEQQYNNDRKSQGAWYFAFNIKFGQLDSDFAMMQVHNYFIQTLSSIVFMFCGMSRCSVLITSIVHYFDD